MSAGNFLIGMGAFVAIGILEPVGEGFGITPAEAGWIMTAYALAYAVGSPILNSLTGAIERRKVMVSGMALFALAALACACAQTPGQLFAARVVAAFGAGLYTPLAAATAAASVDPARRGRALAAVFFGLTLSQVLGVPVGSWIAYTFGWRWAFAIVAALAVPTLAILWWKVPKEVPFVVTGLSTLRSTLSDRAAMARVAYTPLLMGAIFTVFTYITPYLSHVIQADRDTIALLLLLCGLSAVVGNLTGGWLSDALSPRRMLMLVGALKVVTLPLFSLIEMPRLGLLVFIPVWAAIGWSFNAAQQSRLIQFSPERTSVLLALNAAGIYVGSALGSALGGLVLAQGSVWGLGAAGGVLAALALWNIYATRDPLSSSKHA
ncbi:MAG: MFS transporter [Pseudomonadota bacterium]